MTAGALLVLAVYAFTTLAFAEEALPGTAEAAKRLALDSGTWGTLLALALAAVVAEFGVIMRLMGKISAVQEKAKSEAATAAEKTKAEAATTSAEHVRELSELQDGFSRERSEWHAATTLLQEQRLSLLRETMTGLNNSSNVMQALQASVSERTQTASELAAQIASMVSAVQSLKSGVSDDISDLRKKIKENTEQTEALASGLRKTT